MVGIPWHDLCAADVEDLIATLLVRTVDGAVPSDGPGGDSGVDVVAQGPAGDHVFAIKGFGRRLTTAQKRQVLESLGTAVKRQPNMVAWTLVLPLDLSPVEQSWLREVASAVTTVEVNWMGRTALEAAFAERPDLASASLPRSSERRVLEPLVEQGIGEVQANDENGGPGTGHLRKSQDRSDGVHNTVVGGKASIVVQSGVISGDVRIPVTVHRALSGMVARQLPPSTEFVGRTRELAVLRDILCSDSPTGTVVVSAVAGMAGVGKTALAVKAAHAAMDHDWFSGGVLFLDLHGYDRVPVSPARALDSLLRGLGVPGDEIPPETADRVGLYRSVLAGSTGSVLIVLDNASSAEQVRPLLPGDARHRVVVTSRHSLPQLSARHLELAVLSADEAVGILDAAVRAADPSDARIGGNLPSARRVASYCGHLPLALQIAAALLVFDQGKPVAELASELAESHTRLDHLDDGERAVRAAFDLSYHRLPSDQARLFRLFGVHPGPDVATDTVAALADRDEPVARRMLAELARAHLVEPAPVRGRWRMHDLIRIYAERVPSHYSQADERQRARDRLCEYLLYRADAADDHLTALPQTPVSAEFTSRDEALAWFDAERATLVAVTSMAADHGRDDIAHHLPARLVEYFSWRRHLNDWLATALISKQAATRLRDPNLEATALSNYGNVLRELHQLDEAVGTCQTAVTLARSIRDRHREAGALLNLGLALRYTGQVDEAISVCSQAYDAFRHVGDQRGEARALNNLGNVLCKAGRLEKASDVHREHLDLSRRTGDRVGEMMALIGLGNTFERAGKARMSADSYEAALAICREAGNQRLLSTLLNNLGHVLRQLGRTQEASAMHEQDLEVCREAQDLPGEARALVGIALVLDELGKSHEALDMHRRAVERARESGHSDIESIAQTNLSNMLFQQGHWKEAIATCQRTADLFRRSGQPAEQAMILYNLGYALQEENRPKEAVRAYGEAASLCRAIDDRHGEARALEARGNAFCGMRHVQQARRDHAKALTIARKLGDQLAEGRALVGLGKALLAAKRPKDAVRILRQAVDVTRQNGDTKQAVLALCHLGAALMDSGRGDDSFPLFDEAIKLSPDTDPLEILYLGTQGKVRPFSVFLLESGIVEDTDQGYRAQAQPARRKRKRKRHNRRR
jgi:tetratricopeptide (TPR) repeat protein